MNKKCTCIIKQVNGLWIVCGAVIEFKIPLIFKTLYRVYYFNVKYNVQGKCWSNGQMLFDDFSEAKDVVRRLNEN